ncbi:MULTISPECIES: acyltransferase family protein [unclassified Coleofasciculus]|uniref:acyltransferase family protein n=1 Tax=unclassified Coleofasciculus TaxID=2692782 RepID=UPI0018804E79|nr:MULTISPECIES: acyltransferase [unclassified Coleofasciculus]MBE9125747.1 acyltransferase [Coleofasciculus sp. LEGE 07081]MBE9147235.1 acyltransferase [Coleofasciculus sp. LEGE 07092]
MMQWKILAGLRFFLAWIVVCDHVKINFPDSGYQGFFSFFSKFNSLAAVLGFLLISGYSIASSIGRNSKGFYQRRILRIYPLYFCAVLFSLIPFWMHGKIIELPRGESVQPSWFTVFGNLLFLKSFVGSVDDIKTNVALWTLSIEVMCYLLAPLFFKASYKILILLILLSASFYLLSPYLYLIVSPDNKFPFPSELSYGLSFVLLLWVWLSGFFYFVHKDNKFSKIGLIGLGVITLLINSNYIGKSGLITYCVSCLVLIYLPYLKFPNFLLKIFNYLGNISYPLYLFHLPTFFVAYLLLGINNSILLVLLALLNSILFYHVIDIPIRIRKKPAPLS